MTEHDPLDAAQDALNKMRRAHLRGTGCHLSAEEIASLALSTIGELWSQDDPRGPVTPKRKKGGAR